MNIGNRTALPLASSGCSCCPPAGAAQEARAVVNSGTAPSSPRRFMLEGLTCGHCVRTVETAVSGLEDVDSAAVDLVPGGPSTLTITGNASEDAVREAVTSAGYALAGN